MISQPRRASDRELHSGIIAWLLLIVQFTAVAIITNLVRPPSLTENVDRSDGVLTILRLPDIWQALGAGADFLLLVLATHIVAAVIQAGISSALLKMHVGWYFFSLGMIPIVLALPGMLGIATALVLSIPGAWLCSPDGDEPVREPNPIWSDSTEDEDQW